jgi:NADPH:quinone reductase-like Zn-dependent oxidoreductase
VKAIVWTKYGGPDGLQLREVPMPSPKEQEVLIKVHAATVSTPDTEFRRLKLPILFAIPLRLYLGVFRPTRITFLGTEFAGEIIEVGRDVTQYKAGDSVFGYTGSTRKRRVSQTQVCWPFGFGTRKRKRCCWQLNRSYFLPNRIITASRRCSPVFQP